MSENLIAGYLAYTTAVEFGADAAGHAAASTPTVITTVTTPEITSVATASAGISVATAH